MTKPYEKAMMEFRQVMESKVFPDPKWPGDMFPSNKEEMRVVNVQQKWMVQDGEPFEMSLFQHLASDEAEWPLPSSSCTAQVDPKFPMIGTITNSGNPTKSVVKLKEEWRALPIIWVK